MLKLVKPTAEQSAFIERVGRWWETVSGSRTAGQILGLLMICEPAHHSSAELAEALKISAGSVSTQTRVLERIGFLERITFPGDRATYYQLKPHVWSELMWSEQQRIEEMKILAEAAKSLTPETRPDRVEELGEVAGFFLERWPDLMADLTEYLKKERAI
jgi:DNA-binding transcriptional regulator GbsR (MarR family)